MKSTLAVRELHSRHAFRIARARQTPTRNVYLCLEHEGVIGYGEASPSMFYGETSERVVEKLRAAAGFIGTLAPRTAAEIAAAWEEGWPLLQPSRAAQCALDLALWDWTARRLGLSVAELAWGWPAEKAATFCTIGLSTPAELEVKLAEVDGFRLVKIKSDAQADLRPLWRARERSQALLAVDANCAWDFARLPELTSELARAQVAFLEQPLAPAEDERLARGAFRVPIMADESCATEADLDRIAGHFDGFNIKLVKCGGLTSGLRMLARGRSRGCTVMVGCMLESSLLIAAGLVLRQGADFADLDGAWLLADEPFRGLGFERGELLPAAGFGFGVEPEAALFNGAA